MAVRAKSYTTADGDFKICRGAYSIMVFRREGKQANSKANHTTCSRKQISKLVTFLCCKAFGVRSTNMLAAQI
jgi:hypothetical protein